MRPDIQAANNPTLVLNGNDAQAAQSLPAAHVVERHI
jgi:hypothetical protein